MTPPPGTRTSLAWQRTGLGLIGVGALLGGRAFYNDSLPVLLIAASAALVGAGVLGVLAPVRSRLLQRRRAAGQDVAAPGAAITVTLGVVLVGAAAVWAVLVTLR